MKTKLNGGMIRPAVSAGLGLLLVSGLGVMRAPAATEATGVTTSGAPTDKISDDAANADDITGDLGRQRRLDALWGDWDAPRWLDLYREKRDALFERIHLDMGTSYSVAGLAATGYGAPVYGASGDLTVVGVWEFAGRKWDRPLDLRFRMRERHAIGGLAASEVTDASGGVFWGMIDGFSDAGFEIPDFQLVQHLPKRGIEIRVGQMTIDSQFDRHGLRSSKQAFLNRAFSSNPAVAFPRFGAGATMVWKPEGRDFDITIGSSTVQGTQNGSQVDLSFDSTSFFTALQFGRDFKLLDHPSRFQAMIWHSDEVEDEDTPEGDGLSLTFEHWLKDSKNRLFARAAWADGAAADTDRLFSAGVAIPRCENDLLGFAIGTGRRSSCDDDDSCGNDDWQVVLETFYRRQVGPNFHVTPEAQMIFGDGLEDHLLRLVFGLRGHLSF